MFHIYIYTTSDAHVFYLCMCVCVCDFITAILWLHQRFLNTLTFSDKTNTLDISTFLLVGESERKL